MNDWMGFWVCWKRMGALRSKKRGRSEVGVGSSLFGYFGFPRRVESPPSCWIEGVMGATGWYGVLWLFCLIGGYLDYNDDMPGD